MADIDISVAAPGAAEAARSIAAVRKQLADAQGELDGAVKGTKEYDAALASTRKSLKESEKAELDHARALGGTKAAVADAAKAFAAGAAIVGGFALAVVGASAKVLESAGAFEQQERAVNMLGAAYYKVQAATAGTVTAQEALKVQQGLVQSGLRVSSDELAAITRKARDYALATGTDTPQALEQLTEALRSGSADALAKFDIKLDATKGRVENFHTATGNLTKAQKEQKVAQTTLNEELGKTPGLVSSMVGSLAMAVTKAFGLGDALRGLNRELTEFADNQRRMEKDAERVRLAGARAQTNVNLDAWRNRGVVGLPSFDTRFVKDQDLIEKVGVATGAVSQREMDSAMHNALSTVGGQAFAGLSNAQLTQVATGLVIKERLGRMRITQADLDRAMGEGDAAHGLAMSGDDSVGPARGHETNRAGSGGGGRAQGPDASDITDQMRRINRIGGVRGMQTGMEQLGRQGGESPVQYIERVGAMLEERYVDIDARLIRKRGETEFAFAQRRLELADQTLKALSEKEATWRAQQAKAGEEAFARTLELAKADMASVDASIASIQPKGRGESDLILDKLKSGDLTAGGVQNSIEGSREDLTKARALGNNAEAESIRNTNSARAEAIKSYNELAAAQAKASDYGTQFADAFKSNADLTATGAQSLAKTASGAFNTLTSAFKSHVGAVIAGKESVGEALRAITNETLTSLAQESVVQALFQTAQGFGALATYRYPEAVQHFTSAGIFAAVAAAAGIGAAATAAPASAGAAAGGGASANAGAGGGRVPPSNNSRASDSGPVTNIINYNGTAFATTAEMEQFIGRGLSTIGRNGNVPRAFATGVFRSQGL